MVIYREVLSNYYYLIDVKSIVPSVSKTIILWFGRIDFEDFSIYGPSNSREYDEGIAAWATDAISGGKCADDTFIVTAPSSSSFTVPTICGKNTGEHS